MNSQKIKFRSTIGENDVVVEATYTTNEPFFDPELKINKVFLGRDGLNGGLLDLNSVNRNTEMHIVGLYEFRLGWCYAPDRPLSYDCVSIEDILIDAAFDHLEHLGQAVSRDAPSARASFEEEPESGP